jgi:hypothetical protein
MLCTLLLLLPAGGLQRNEVLEASEYNRVMALFQG